MLMFSIFGLACSFLTWYDDLAVITFDPLDLVDWSVFCIGVCSQYLVWCRSSFKFYDIHADDVHVLLNNSLGFPNRNTESVFDHFMCFNLGLGFLCYKFLPSKIVLIQIQILHAWRKRHLSMTIVKHLLCLIYSWYLRKNITENWIAVSSIFIEDKNIVNWVMIFFISNLDIWCRTNSLTIMKWLFPQILIFTFQHFDKLKCFNSWHGIPFCQCIFLKKLA